MKFALLVTDLAGDKKDVSYVSINIRDIEKQDKENFEKVVVETLSANKGFLSKNAEVNEVLALFLSPLDAIKAAVEIQEKTGPINVIMGIGIHTSQTLVNEGKDQLKYASMGSAVSIARKISQASRNNVLISKDTKIKAGGEARVEQAGEYFLAKGISRRESFKKDVDRIVKNIKSEGKGFGVVR